MFKQMWTHLGKHPVEVSAGVILVVLGVLMTAAGASGPTYLLYTGSLGTAFGGVVLSWTVGKAFSRQEAIEEIGSQLGLVSKTLGQAAGQMSRVVDQCADHSMPSETGFALIGQSATLIGAQVSAIQGILGNPFEAGDLLSTLSEMENLAEKLDRRDRRESGSVEVANEVVEVRSRLQEMRADLTGITSTRGRVAEVTTCPNCGREATALLGPYPGDTAASVCRSCGVRFNAHRRSDGTVFSRPMGGTAAGATTSAAPGGVEVVSFDCPSCKSNVRLRTSANTLVARAVCLRCCASIMYDKATKRAATDGAFERITADPVGRDGSSGASARPIVRCESCSRQLQARVRVPEGYYAIDNTCRRLYSVSDEAFVKWRAHNEPDFVAIDGQVDPSNP